MFTLGYFTFDRMVSTLLHTHVRGIFRINYQPISARYLKEFPFIEIFIKVLNFLYVYKLLKKFTELKYIVSVSRVCSRFAGFVCKLYVPVFLRTPFFGTFGRVYGVKIEEAERDRYDMYNDFTDFFTRRLKAGVRVIDKPDDIYSISSPCDGRVLSFGEVNAEDSTIDCVKGRSYRLDEFLTGVIGDENDPSSRREKIRKNKSNPAVLGLLNAVRSRGNKLHYMVIYLSPGDYHRFHSPAIHTADFRRHVVGYLSPVKPSYVENHPDTFAKNERVNIFGQWRGQEENFFFLSYVGALNVGSICLDFDTEVVTNVSFPKAPYSFDKAYNPSMVSPLSNFVEGAKPSTGLVKGSKTVKFAKGEMTGRFEMGSTIVLIYEAPAEGTKTLIEEG